MKDDGFITTREWMLELMTKSFWTTAKLKLHFFDDAVEMGGSTKWI